MLSWRARRQLTVILIILLLVGGITVYAIWKVFPASSCIDGKKNQGELEIDCGGPCGPCELKHPQAIEKFWARAVPIGGNKYDIAAEIKNSNEVLFSAQVRYEFILADEFGIISQREGETFIYPQERMHVIEANLEAGRAPSRVEFKITGVEWQYQKLENPNLVTERRDYQIVSVGNLKQSVVDAQILNRSPQDFPDVEVGFLLLDQDGNILGANRVSTGAFLSGEHKKVKSIWPQEFSKTPANILVEPRVNPVLVNPHT